ncbi:MAPEG family protein [Roseibacterium beibuensis]|uniref:MAPEG family protein n=1 Tax=[Roseibacterium] beibuensis TaxID=1193142 RepID=UPI00217DCAE9|nr:MAPEG family protein [Roseibacterium beibuensis]MCS6625245.1 MAPEG family protein [Roseibacterium beibuensis]
MSQAMLQPVIALVLWSMVMWAWLYATRLPAMARARTPLDPTQPRDVMLGGLPPRVRWKADNYNHLMEQPTLFYATALTLAVLGQGDAINLGLAWAYVALRVVHSLIQALGNVIAVRFAVFMAASVVLVVLALRAAFALV